MKVRPTACEQAAQWASLDLDGELSRFERKMLDRHLSRCPRCSEESHRTAVLTAVLRSQPLEEVRIPVTVTRRRQRVGMVQRVVAVAAMAAVAVWFGVSMTGKEPVNRLQPNPWPAPSAAAASNGRFDWPASGPPRTQQVVQFVPGGLFTAGT